MRLSLALSRVCITAVQRIHLPVASVETRESRPAKFPSEHICSLWVGFTMSTPALIDFETLLAPIPGDDPAGKAVPFATREIFDKARKEINPDAFAPDDPLRPT